MSRKFNEFEIFSKIILGRFFKKVAYRRQADVLEVIVLVAERIKATEPWTSLLPVLAKALGLKVWKNK